MEAWLAKLKIANRRCRAEFANNSRKYFIANIEN